MKFRSIPPNPDEFPRIKLIWPIAVPAALLLLVFAADRVGHQWNIHGDGALVAVAFFVSLIVGTVASIVSLASLLPALRQHPTLRTRTNLACAAASAVFVLGATGIVLINVAKLASP